MVTISSQPLVQHNVNQRRNELIKLHVMAIEPNSDLIFMNAALEEAHKAFTLGEVPVGAVLVHDDTIIARGHNLREWQQNPTAHAELLVIQRAAEGMQSWRLLDTTLYVTLEPCLMCAGAVLQARIPRLVFGTMDPKAGACGSLFTVHQDSRLNHQVNITQGIQEEPCRNMLKDFFQQLRQDRPLLTT